MLQKGIADVLGRKICGPEAPVAGSFIHIHCCRLDGCPCSSEITCESGLGGTMSNWQDGLCGGGGKVLEKYERKVVSAGHGQLR